MADYQTFKQNWLGKRIDYDHVFDYQCVDLILQWCYEQLHVNGLVRGNAIDYATNPSPALLDKCDRITDYSDLQPGDVIVFRSRNAPPGDYSGFGHIALCDHQVGASVFILEQNGYTGNGSGTDRDAIGVWRSVLKERIAAVYREKAPVPQPSYTYERLAAPLRVRVKPGCNLWDLNYAADYANARSLAQLSTDPANPTDFTAVGKAIKQDMPQHPVYFMSAESFGNADVSGVPAYNQGVNTVDVEPAPEPPAPAVPEPSAVVAPATQAEPVATPQLEGEHIEVKVNPPNPEAWKTSYKTNDSGDYIAKASVIVHDLDGKEPDIQLVKGQTVIVAGTFTGADSIKYYRTKRAADGWTDEQGVKHAPNWRGIPTESLEEDDAQFTFKDEMIDDFHEMKGYIGTKQKAIIAAAKIHGEVNWLSSRLKIKKGK